MKEPRSISSSPENQVRFSIKGLKFLSHGPYNLDCGVESVGLTGASGVGKTLFLRAVADLDRHEGTITLAGRECSSFSAPEWRRHVALIPAESRWWYHDVRSHMPADIEPDETRDLLGSLGFMDDVLGWEVRRLSTGEKQRLALARVLFRKPSVLLLDETGSGLDQKNALLLEEVISRYQTEFQTPVIWVSHDREQINRVCDRLFVLHSDMLEIKDDFKATEHEVDSAAGDSLCLKVYGAGNERNQT